MFFVRYTIIINVFLCIFVFNTLNALSFFNFTDSHLSKFFSAYEQYISNAEKKNIKEEEKIFKEAYDLLIKNYIYEYNDKAKDDLINKAIEYLKIENDKLKSTTREVSAKTLMQNTMLALFNSIDAHTVYMIPSKADEFTSHLTGKYKGIGVMFNFDKTKNLLKIIKVFDNSPAKKAGIQKNDYIYAVNAKQITINDKLDEIINTIKGSDGTTVKITLKRDDELIDVLVTRGDYYVPSVEYKIYDNKYAYIVINSFNQDTATLFRNAIYATSLNSLDGLIIDIRNNPGGLLPAVVLVADNILSGEKIVSIKGRDENYNKTFLSINKILVKDDIPIVVLINSLSASASELLSGALAINNRAVLMGESTFGKWSVQSSYNLSDKSIFNITTQLFYGPKNSTFQGIGIAPDIEIVDSKTKVFREKDYPNYLKTSDINNVIRSPKISVLEKKCPSNYENSDYILGCAILYLQSNSNIESFKKRLK